MPSTPNALDNGYVSVDGTFTNAGTVAPAKHRYHYDQRRLSPDRDRAPVHRIRRFPTDAVNGTPL
ncbi:MAG: hypothetical protein ACLR7Z_18300 [Bilophila wadsworthia]